jgi:hypothetical protein
MYKMLRQVRYRKSRQVRHHEANIFSYLVTRLCRVASAVAIPIGGSANVGALDSARERKSCACKRRLGYTGKPTADGDVRAEKHVRACAFSDRFVAANALARVPASQRHLAERTCRILANRLATNSKSP